MNHCGRTGGEVSDLQETTVGSYKVGSRGDKVSLECLDKSGEFVIGAYITPRDAREVAAALVSVADELCPHTSNKP